MKVFCLFGLLLVSYVVQAADDDNKDNAADSTNTKDETTAAPKPLVTTPPPNEWGSYLSLEGEQFDDKLESFTIVWTAYKSDPKKATKCKDATFNRWYVSSEDPQLFILSYFCMTSGLFGYEHLKVKNNVVLDFQDSLKGFKIADAGEYSASGDLKGETAEKVQDEMLKAVKGQVDALVWDKDATPPKKVCPGAGTQTLWTVQRKTENELDYHRFPISCNITGASNSHMTHIEIAKDNTRLKYKEGKATLVSMAPPERNTAFIERKKIEIATGKMSHAVVTRCSLVALVFVPVLKMLM